MSRNGEIGRYDSIVHEFNSSMVNEVMGKSGNVEMGKEEKGDGEKSDAEKSE